VPPTLTALLKEARRRERKTQLDVARALDVRGPTYSRWENQGRIPKTEKAEEIAKLLGIPMERMVAAMGVPVSSPPEWKLYRPLAAYLARMSIDGQKALLAHLQEAASLAASAQPR
jgi:transcriptional regulator with XRE-family HTH domain